MCDYVNILDKRIPFQQRALACQSKALAHILQKEIFTLRNSVLIKHEAKMAHFQPHLGDTRPQELRSSSLCPTPLFHSQLV